MALLFFGVAFNFTTNHINKMAKKYLQYIKSMV